MPMAECTECGQECAEEESAGVFHHLTSEGEVDYEKDADHVPIPEVG